MDEKPDQIAQHIETQRSELGRNLDELQDRVRETTDWRRQFDRHPYIMIGAAMGGGMILSSMIGAPSSRSRSYSDGSASSESEEDLPRTSSYYMNQGAGSSHDISPARYRESAGGGGSSMSMMHQQQSPQRQRAWQMFETMKTALFTLAAERAQEYLNDLVPGFRDHFRQAQSRMGFSEFGGSQQSYYPGQQQQQHQPWGQGQQQHWESQQNRDWQQNRGGFNPPPPPPQQQQQHRWSGSEPWRQSGERHDQGQWPQERNWEHERYEGFRR